MNEPRKYSPVEIAAALRGLAIRVHETARLRGYYGGTRNVTEALMFATRELGYAANDVRKARKLGAVERDASGKPYGFAISVARCVIRLSDICEYVGADLGKAVAAEMAWNEAKAAKRG